jgi:hypothetical protein
MLALFLLPLVALFVATVQATNGTFGTHVFPNLPLVRQFPSGYPNGQY